MRTIRLLTAILALATAAAFVNAGPARACSCVDPDPNKSPEEREAASVEGSDAVFVGEVTSTRAYDDDGNPATQGPDDRRDMTLRVIKIQKGPVTDPFEVSTGGYGDTCAKVLEEGVTYKVFAGETEGRYWITNCGATREATEADLRDNPAPTTTTTPTTRPPPPSTTSTTSTTATSPAATSTSSTTSPVTPTPSPTAPPTGEDVALDAKPTSSRAPAGLLAAALLPLVAAAVATLWLARRAGGLRGRA